MRYAIVTGEVSGDRHGRDLMLAIRKHDAGAEFGYVGGNFMDQVGGTKFLDIQSLSIMGFGEVIIKLPKLFLSIKKIKSEISQFKPDVVILIDNAGLNLRIAKWASLLGYKVAYYILPKAWAWNAKRTNKLKRFSNLNLSILPFEKSFFTAHKVNLHYVGNPSKNQVELWTADNRETEKKIDKKPILALLPGSRKQEVQRMLPLLVQFGKEYLNDFRVIISQNPMLNSSYYQLALDNGFQLESNYYSLLSRAKFAVVTSGTATLETALFKVPQVVAYKTSFVSYQIAKRLVKVDHISLVNLIADMSLVDELIQHQCNLVELTTSFEKLLKMSHEAYGSFYDALDSKLGKQEASAEAAILILKLVNLSSTKIAKYKS